MELICPNSQHQDFDDLYRDVYQLHRLPGWGRCEEATEEQLCQEVLDSIKEHLRVKQPPAQPEKQWMQLLANAHRPDPCMAFAAMNCETYEEMMALARDTQQWALVAVAILEEQIERISCSTDCWHSTSCWQSSICWCSANCRSSQSSEWQEEVSQVVPHFGEIEVKPGRSQVNSHWGRILDIDFFQHWRMTQVTWCWGSTTQEQTQSPSPTRQRCQVTFTKGIAPLLGASLRHGARECPCDARGRNVLSIAPTNMADWGNTTRDDQLVETKRGGPNYPSQRRCRSWVSLTTGSPAPTTPGWGGGGDLPGGCQGRRWPPAPPTSSSPPPPLPHEDPETSTLHASDWIEWCTRYVQKLSWSKELTKIPSHADHKEFAWKLHASFEVPKACNWVKKVNNHHVQPPAHPSIGRYHFLPLRDVSYSTQDIHLAQLQHTVACARPLQHWAEEVHPPVPSQPCHLARSVQELWWALEPLITFIEGDVFMVTALSKWMEITSPRLMKAVPQKSPKSCSRSSRACLRGLLSVTHSRGWPAATTMWATTKAEALTTPPQEFMPHQSTIDSQPLCPLPGFVEMTQTLWRGEPVESGPLLVITGVLSKKAIDPYEVMGMAMMATQLHWQHTTREVLVDIQFCSEGIMGLGLDPVADTCPALTHQELTGSDN